MVEITHISESDDALSTAGEEESKYRLLFSKSKVYVNPTAYARDNIPGFVALVKRVCIPSPLPSTPHHGLQEAVNPTYLLAWIPETLLNEKGTDEWDKFVKIEERASTDEEEEGRHGQSYHLLYRLTFSLTDGVLIDLPTQRPESYAFSVPLTSIYSLLVHPPTLSSWCKSLAAFLLFQHTNWLFEQTAL